MQQPRPEKAPRHPRQPSLTQNVHVGKEKVHLFQPGSRKGSTFRGKLFRECPGIKVKCVLGRGEVVVTAQDHDSLRNGVDVVKEIGRLTLRVLPFPSDFAAELRRNKFRKLNKMRNKHDLWFLFLEDNHTLSILGTSNCVRFIFLTPILNFLRTGSKENVTSVLRGLNDEAVRFKNRTTSIQECYEEEADDDEEEEEEEMEAERVKINNKLAGSKSQRTTIHTGQAKSTTQSNQGNIARARSGAKEVAPSCVLNVPSSPKATIRWYWKDEQEQWVRYPTYIEVKLETRYLQVATSKTKATLYTFPTASSFYEVKLRDGMLMQENLTTGTRRSVKRDGTNSAIMLNIPGWFLA